MVPQSLGYAALAGAPVQAGLYALPLALGVYAFVGSSPQLIVGPVSTVSVLTGSIVASHGAKSPEEALALVAQREAARSRRDWAEADRLRAQVAALGWEVRDTPAGPQVTPPAAKRE